jgi:hypothetical protein
VLALTNVIFPNALAFALRRMTVAMALAHDGEIDDGVVIASQNIRISEDIVTERIQAIQLEFERVRANPVL